MKGLGFVILSLMLLSVVSACGYKDHGDCGITKTIVEGRIYFADTNQSAGNADVTITCTHNGHDYTKTAHSLNYGNLKGTYIVTFPQENCIKGDSVVVSAVSKDGKTSGVASGTVKDWITQKCLDIDLGIVNVPLVPEFGVVAGAATVLSALAIFFVVRKK